MTCTDAEPVFDWCEPAIFHFRWNISPVVRRIVRWANNISRGKNDLSQTRTPAEFVTGGTIGPVKGG